MSDHTITTFGQNANLPARLVYNGEVIRDRGEMVSLTDMWKAGGADESKRPANWARKDGAEFIAHMTAVLNMPEGHIISGTRGRTGATFAHWQIALAYAKYLSPEFHMWCNQVVRERMEGRRGIAAPGLTREDFAAIGNIVKNCSGVMVREYVRELLPSLVEQRLLETQAGVVRGLTAGDILDMAGVKTRKGLRGLAGFVSNRVRRFCAERGFTVKMASLGSSTAYVFDRLAVREWLDNGGRAEIERKIAERRGQGVLQFPGARP